VATHFFDAKQLAAMLTTRGAAPEADLKDLAGDRVHLRGDSRIALDLTFPDQYRITLPREKFPTAEAARAVLAKVGFDAIEPARLPVELPEGPDVLILVGRPRPEVREGVIKTIQGMSPQSVVAPNPADPAEIYVSIPKSVYAEGLPQALRHLENIGVEGVAP